MCQLLILLVTFLVLFLSSGLCGVFGLSSTPVPNKLGTEKALCHLPPSRTLPHFQKP